MLAAFSQVFLIDIVSKEFACVSCCASSSLATSAGFVLRACVSAYLPGRLQRPGCKREEKEKAKAKKEAKGLLKALESQRFGRTE